MRHFLVWARLGSFEIPVFPGGALVGLVLTLNLVASLFARLAWTLRKLGLWLVHAGLILLFAGEFVTAAFQDDMRMTIEEGQTVSYLESARDIELAVIDTTDPAFDEVFAIPATRLAEYVTVDLPNSPISLNVRRFFANAQLSDRASADPPPVATMGVGPGVTVVERDVATSDDEDNHVSALIEPMIAGRGQGVWLVSKAVDAPQAFTHEGHTYRLSMRPRRSYLPYTISLKKFTHAVYPGTDIPKDFSSLVHISNPLQGEARDVLIYMNQPLRYDGKAFYQASFGKGDTLSILQVVENPGWLLPYVSCVLVTLGLLFHFALSLRRRKR
jgi:cytochrome c biogenesis protein ResB